MRHKELPNILLITTDQQNAETLGCAGNRIIKTPHIDSIAKRGVNFASAFTVFPVCTPARSSIFCGRYVHHHGLSDNVNMGNPVKGLSKEEVIFPTILKEAGYQNAYIGKLHTKHEGKPDFDFDVFKLVEGKCHFVPEGTKDIYRQELEKIGRLNDYRTWETGDYQKNYCTTSPLGEESYVDTFIGNLACEYLGKAKPPFFTWVSFCSPHNPWDPPQPFDKMYSPEDIPLPHRKIGELANKPGSQAEYLRKIIPALPNTTQGEPRNISLEEVYNVIPDETVKNMIAHYYGTISLVDKQVGRILEILREKEWLNNTLIIYTTDHGEHLGNNWLFYKWPALYDSLIRLPFIVSWPAKIPQRITSNALVSLVDLMPTFLFSAGLELPGNLDGVSLLDENGKLKTPSREEIFVNWGGVTSCVRTKKWKLVLWKRTGEGELYDLEKDPYEFDNMYSRKEFQSVITDLREKIHRWER